MERTALNRDQQDLVDLLRNELAELIEQDMSMLEGTDLGARRECLEELQQHLDNIGNAGDMVGLYGLRDCCHHLAANFGLVAASTDTLDDGKLLLLQSWGIYLLGYLQCIGDEETALQAAADLLEFLAEPDWASPLGAQQAEAIREQFQASDLSIDEDSSSTALPEIITHDMVSLAIGEDVRPELLQGLLTELPEQVRFFEHSITRYLESGQLTDLAPAQRYAHTIKGSANVVGIAGAANLMHYMEDMLEAAARTPERISDGFDDLLRNAADCLAAMAENLAGVGPPPDDAVDVLTELIQWVRQFKADERTQPTPFADEYEIAEDLRGEEAAGGISVEQLDVTEEWSEAQEPLPGMETAPIFQDPIAKDDDVHPRQTLTIAGSLAQELLRLAGETQITNTQAAAQIDMLAASVSAAEHYHRDIKALSTELEHLVEIQGTLTTAGARQTDQDMDPLELEGYNELHSFSHKLLELATDSHEAIEHMAQQITDLKSLALGQQQLNKENQQLVLQLRMVPVKTMTSRFMRCVRQASRLTGKKVALHVEGEGILMDSRVLQQVADPIMHLLRNAVDHGLEAADARISAGKSPEGQVRLRFAQSGETIVIQCSDDGRGLDYERIAAVARRRQLANDEFLADRNNLRQLVMMPGFSTRDTVSQTSGRGIGLDAVVAEVRDLKGKVSLESEPGHGCCFTLSVPTSILSGHAILVRTRGSSGDHTLSIVTRSIEQIIYLMPTSLYREDGKMYFEWENEKLPVFELNDLTQIHLQQAHGDNGVLLLTRKADGSRFGVLVEVVLASQDLVIKPLGRYTYKSEGVVGATILGDGAVSPVVDLQELPGTTLGQEALAVLRAERAQLAEARGLDAIQQKPMALVVDDSLSARRSLAQFISDMGLDVRTARDGFEAINIIDQRCPVLMLVDLEMPRMNGLELTTHVRSRPETKDIPVIMITSRTTDKHRRMAASAGVTSYLTKPWSDDELLTRIQEQIA